MNPIILTSVVINKLVGQNVEFIIYNNFYI